MKPLQYALIGCAIVALGYAVFKPDRRPLERIVNVVCAGVTIYLAAFTVWW